MTLWKRFVRMIVGENESWAAATDPQAMNARLRAPLARHEILALLLAVLILIIFLWIYELIGYTPFDYWVYFQTTQGNFENFYYAYWILPLFEPMALVPISLGYFLWGILNCIAILFAARVFGGRGVLALLSFQMLFSLVLGQIVGLLAAGLALLWWGLAQRRWLIAGVGLALAAAKIHIGATIGLLLLWMSPAEARHKLRVLLVPAGVALLSLAVWPGWPMELQQNLSANPPIDWGSISLWRWIGPWALLLFLPPLLIEMAPHRRLLALGSAAALALPYFQQADLLTLFVLPLGWAPLILGNLGYLFFAYYWKAIHMLFLVPLLIYLAAIFAVWPTRKRRWTIAQSL